MPPAPDNPMSVPSGSPSQASKCSLLMAGISCDVYGLDEIASLQPAMLSCLWLHHPRLRTKEDMEPFACRIVSEWHKQPQAQGSKKRGLVAIAFDQRNHGSRMVEKRGNLAWRNGNPTHAIDMFGQIEGMVSDTQGLMNLVGGYVRAELDRRRGIADGWVAEVDQHLVLGVSLGGHSAWQALFRDARISCGVVIIGCPDYMALLSNRAKLSKLETFNTEDEGASFLGSRDFPTDLVRACLDHDPKGLLFGTGPAQSSITSLADQNRLKTLLDTRIRGKKILVCSGGNDKLVPYAMSKPFVEFLEHASQTWFADGGVLLENKVYQGVGHAFSEEMVEDSVRFLLDALASASGEGDEQKSKI